MGRKWVAWRTHWHVCIFTQALARLWAVNSTAKGTRCFNHVSVFCKKAAAGCNPPQPFLFTSPFQFQIVTV